MGVGGERCEVAGERREERGGGASGMGGMVCVERTGGRRVKWREWRWECGFGSGSGSGICSRQEDGVEVDGK